MNLQSIAIAAAIAAAAGGAIGWGVTSSHAEKQALKAEKAAKEDKDKAVAETLEEAQKRINEMERERTELRAVVASQQEALKKKITTVTTQREEVVRVIQDERRSNPEFYDQPIPDKGREAWMKARKLAENPTMPTPSGTASGPSR